MGVERRLTESVDVALHLADDIVVINAFEHGDRLFSRRLACVDCGISVPEMTPRAFSFNCRTARVPTAGLGSLIDFDPRRLVPDESLSLSGGAILPWSKGDKKLRRLQAPPKEYGVDPMRPSRKLPKKHANCCCFGAPKGAAPAKVRRAHPQPSSTANEDGTWRSRRNSRSTAHFGHVRRAAATG